MKTTKTSDMVNNSEEIANFEQRERTDSNPISHGDDVNKNIEVIYERSQQQNFCQNLSTAVQSNITQSGTRTILGTKLGENVATESHKIDPFREMLKLLQQSPDKVNQDVSKYAYLTVLDFAGQYAFYTTHQMFLITWAIYLLVSDASRDISDLVEDECYFDSEGIMQCQIYDNILPMHPGFIVTGLPSKMCGSGSSKMDHSQYFEDANFNMRSSNSQPPKTIIKAAEMRGNMNNHYCNQDLFETASDKNGGKGDSSSLRGGQSHSKGGNSNVQSNSWYRRIGGHAPSFAPGHMTEPYTRDVQQPGSRKSEIKADGYVSHTFQTVEGSTSNGLDPYEMHVPTFWKRSDGYPFTETPYNHNQSYRQHYDQPENQNIQQFSEFINPGTTDENFNKQTRSEDHSSKLENTRKTENQSTAPMSRPRNQSNHTGKRIKIDQPAYKSLDSINDIDSEWKSGGKTATKPGSKPSKPFCKEVDDLDSIDDIDLVYIHSDDKQNDPNKDITTTCI